MPLKLETILEQCRLCQLNKGTVTITDNSGFVSQVLECTKIQLDTDNLYTYPKTVCLSCKLNIEEFFTFVQEIRSVDAKLHNQLAKYNKITYDSSIKTSSTTKNNRSFQCSLCPKSYSKYKILEMHTKRHTSLYCFTCNQKFNDLPSHNAHICKSGATLTKINSDHLFDRNLTLNNKTESDDSASLTDSKSGYIQNGDSNLPEATTHKNQRLLKFPCTFDRCNKVCSTPYTLRSHVLKHEGKTPFLCVTCGKGFTTKNSLNCHEKIHAEIKAYTCKECNIGFSVASNLRAHQKKHHEGFRYYCSQCTRVFTTKCSLERHELVHTGIKQFKCESCKAAFYTNNELIKHQRYHKGLRMYKCDRCFKSFFEKHHLTIHIRVHTGERPYKCTFEECGKTFTESQKLSRHMKARHPQTYIFMYPYSKVEHR